MPAFAVTIEGRTYAGHYHTAANAVFGAMRFRENELYREVSKGLPPFTDRLEGDHHVYQRRLAATRARLQATTHITARMTSEHIAKKVHRVA